MARDFDYFPTYDPLVKDQVYLSNIWGDFMATFVESLREYLSSTGVFVPSITKAQQAAIQTPVEGQLVYISDSNSPTLPRTAALQIWQVIAGVGQWTTIV